MSGSFVCGVSKAGKHRFTLKASNGQVILTSQGYASEASCMAGIASVRKNSQNDKMFTRKTSTDAKFYFTLNSSNGQVIGTSQRYASAAGCKNGIESVKRNAPDAKHVDM